MSDEFKMVSVPLAGYIRLEQQRDAYRDAAERARSRALLLNSGCDDHALQDEILEALGEILGPLPGEGAMSSRLENDAVNDPQTIEDIHRSLEQLYATDQEQYDWLFTRNPMLDGRKPVDLIRAGQEDAVLAVLEILLTSAVG